MTTITYEFDNQADLDDALAHLWDRLAISGEVSVRPLAEGAFRLEIVAEKTLRPATLEKLRGRRIDE
jgi:hypothetical protein